MQISEILRALKFCGYTELGTASTVPLGSKQHWEGKFQSSTEHLRRMSGDGLDLMLAVSALGTFLQCLQKSPDPLPR